MPRATKPKKSLKRRHEPVKMEFPVELKRVNLNAAGIDIGSKRHFVAVPEGRDAVSVNNLECSPRLGSDGGVAISVWGDHCGHGEHRLLLDPGV